ncbi:MAG: ABC transporter ATP-binding protein [bacterium]|nr:ABC transporter ATP-binding protein [bacterium]
MGIVEVKSLRKEYDSLVAVRDISFSVERGQVLGLIGPNGAGKTTLLRILATLLPPTAGEVTINGLNTAKEYLAIRKTIGYLPDFFNLYDDLTIEECLTFFARAYKVEGKEIDRLIFETLNYVDLREKRFDFIRNLSRGMIQRLGVAVLLVRKPDIFLLDEPASGLDPRARAELRQVLTKLSSEGRTIIISSHVLADLADICSHIIIMDKGKFLANGPVREIINQISDTKRIHLEILGNSEQAKTALENYANIKLLKTQESSFIVEIAADLEKVALLNKHLVDQGFKVVSFYEEKANLEDVFLKITGH